MIDVVTVSVLPTLEGRGESRCAFLVCIECMHMQVNKGENKRHCISGSGVVEHFTYVAQ